MDTRELLIQAYGFYQEKKYEESYQFLMDNKAFIAKDSMLYNYLFSLASKLNKVDDALYYFKEALITYDMWYLTEELDRDEDLDNIRSLPEFIKLYNICKQKQIDCRYAGAKKIDIDVPDPGIKKLFFMLHGNSQFVERVKKYYNPTTVKGHIIALPQSREFQAYSNYTWKDVDFGVKVATEHYKEVVEQYEIQDNDVILSSYSSGAQVIMKSVLKNQIPAKKMMFFGPWIPGLADFEDQIHLLKERDVRIFIICGSEDQACLPTAKRLAELFTRFNVDYKFKIIEGLPHTFPNNLEDIMEEALTFFNVEI